MKQITATRYGIAAAIAASLMITSALTGCSSHRAEAASGDGAEPLVVNTARVSIADVASVVESGGVVQARTAAAIAARILAPVREVRVLPGDRVRRGQTLIVLAGDDLAAGVRAARSAAVAAEQGSNAAAAELQAAEAAFALACASYDRIVGLHRTRSATAQELDDATEMRRSAEARVAGAEARARQARSAIESARAAADQADATESFTRITAPFDGTITERMIEPGNMASPAAPLLRLENPRGFRLDVRVDESRLRDVRRGDSIPVALGAEGSVVIGQVDEVSRAVDADTRAFLVKIALPDVPGLRSGQFGKARFQGEPRRGLIIPAAAIVQRGQLTSVFVVENDRARVRLVNVRGSEVTAGLAESEVVILSPPAELTDGRRVSAGGR